MVRFIYQFNWTTNLEGAKFYTVFLKVFKNFPRIDSMIRLHKESVQEPENFYIALPFTVGESETKYIEKTGCLVRPGLDQLPGSNKEFYLIQNGIIIEGKHKSILLAIRDTPLVTFQSPNYRPITLCDGNDTELNKGEIYSWALNNYWETNFKVDLGGFYEFAFSLTFGEGNLLEENRTYMEAINEGVLSFYSK